MIRKEDIELIEKYLNDELSQGDKKSLADRMSEEKDLAKEFHKHQTAHKTLDFLVAKNLKNQLEELEEEEKIVSFKKKRRNRLFTLSIAASIAVLLGFFYLILPSGEISRADLIADYYESPDFGSRSGDSPTAGQELLSRGITAFQNNNYEKAITVLDSIDADNNAFVIAQYVQGHAYHSTGQFQKAEESFARVSASNDLRYREEADWYGLLSCLAQNADCTEKLNQIAGDSDHAYHHPAIEIQQRLK